MKKLIFYCVFLVAATTNAQDFGLILDESKYETVPTLADYELFGSKYSEIPTEHSIKTYCPMPNEQGTVRNCVFQSLSYAAMTITYSVQNHITDPTRINQIRFSALFGYNQVSTNCTGVRFADVLTFLKTKGSVFYADFDATPNADCTKQPTKVLQNKALNYRIKNYSKLFVANTDKERKINLIKKSLATNTPVIVGLKLPKSILDYKGQTEYYEGKGQAAINHAMVVIGYDEFSFELMNSFGTDWGKGGYVKIKYRDFLQYCSEAYQIAFEKRETDTDTDTPKPKPTPMMTGDFEFRTPNEGVMAPMPFEWKEGKYYLATQRSMIDQQFQLSAVNLQKNKYVYVFSHDTEGKTNLHWPKLGGKYDEKPLRESALTPYETTSFVMPGAKRAFTKDKAGTDYLFVLYSDKELDIKDLETRIAEMETDTQPSVLAKFEKAFAGTLLEWNKIKYDANKVSFTAPLTDKIVPLLLRMD